MGLTQVLKLPEVERGVKDVLAKRLSGVLHFFFPVFIFVLSEMALGEVYSTHNLAEFRLFNNKRKYGYIQ